jgi:hypothetical protein
MVGCSLEWKRCRSVREVNSSVEAKRIQSPGSSRETLVNGGTIAAGILAEARGTDNSKKSALTPV